MSRFRRVRACDSKHHYFAVLLIHAEACGLTSSLQTWNTGPLLSDSCGYVALSHPPSPRRIILAFRGTYSIANTIVDLSTVPQEYLPYPANGHDHKCTNCTVHAGFMTSWKHTRPHIIPHLERLVTEYPDYQITVVGHSLGGAVAALAALDFQARGWNPQVTTFGEPRIGNQALMKYIDHRFELGTEKSKNSTYRRVTHVDDPVPLLPLEEWGYRMHAGEVYISKAELSPSVTDLQHCVGDEDPRCIAGAESYTDAPMDEDGGESLRNERWAGYKEMWAVPARYRLWELFFAHRDYFWRLGLCIPGGDPSDWYGKYTHLAAGEL